METKQWCSCIKVRVETVLSKSDLVRNREKCGRNMTPGGNRERAIKSGVSRENREGWQVCTYHMPKTVCPYALLGHHTSGYAHSYVRPLLSCATLILEEYIQYFPNRRFYSFSHIAHALGIVSSHVK